MAKAKVKSQISMDDKVIEDADLEKLLEDREELKESVSQYRTADKKARTKSRPSKCRCPTVLAGLLSRIRRYRPKQFLSTFLKAIGSASRRPINNNPRAAQISVTQEEEKQNGLQRKSDIGKTDITGRT